MVCVGVENCISIVSIISLAFENCIPFLVVSISSSHCIRIRFAPHGFESKLVRRLSFSFAYTRSKSRAASSIASSVAQALHFCDTSANLFGSVRYSLGAIFNMNRLAKYFRRCRSSHDRCSKPRVELLRAIDGNRIDATLCADESLSELLSESLTSLS